MMMSYLERLMSFIPVKKSVHSPLIPGDDITANRTASTADGILQRTRPLFEVEILIS